MNLFPISANRRVAALARDLTPEERSFLKTRQLDASKLPEQWNESLNRLQQIDSLVDRCRAGWRNSAILTGIASAGTALAGDVLPVNPAIVLLIAIIAFVVSIILYIRSRGQDVPNAFRAIATPLVVVLSEDIKDGAELHLRLDMSKPETDAKRIRTEDLAPYSGKSLKRHYYQNPWLACDARLADGAQLSLGLTDLIRVDKIKKRNARGKIKYKTKRKIKRHLDVSVAWPKDTYQLATVSVGDAKHSTKTGDKRDTLRIRKTFVTTANNYFEKWTSVDELYGALFQAYKSATLRDAS